MEIRKVAHDEDGKLSIVMIDGRAFVHGSIVDNGGSDLLGQIARLTAERDALKEEPSLSEFLDWLRDRYGDHPALIAAEIFTDQRPACQQRPQQEKA